MTFEHVTLAAAIVAAGYLFAVCATPPNPSPSRKDRSVKDRMGIFVDLFAVAVRGIMVLHLFYHTLVLVIPAYAPEHMQQICPRAENCNPDLFAWSPTTVTALLSIYIGAFVRLSAYGGLGRYFTFHLAAPDQLVTSGVYRWIQHPSYSGLLLIAFGIIGAFLRWDGVPACWIADDKLALLNGWGLTVFVGFVALEFGLMGTRVRDEEEMLQRQFGKQWEEWHAKTARYIPFLL